MNRTYGRKGLVIIVVALIVAYALVAYPFVRNGGSLVGVTIVYIGFVGSFILGAFFVKD